MIGIKDHTPKLYICRSCAGKVVAHVQDKVEILEPLTCPKCASDKSLKPVEAEWDPRRVEGMTSADHLILSLVPKGIFKALQRNFIDRNWRTLAGSHKNREEALAFFMEGYEKSTPVLIPMKDYDLFGKQIREVE